MMTPATVIASSFILLFATLDTAGAAGSDTSTMSRDECEKTQSAAAEAANGKAVGDVTSGSSVTSDTGKNVASDNSTKDPDKVVNEIVKNAKPSEGGQMVAETGRARPVESWFGCPPK